MKQVEIERVDEELASKRKEFRHRMNDCAEKQIQIQKRQQRVRVFIYHSRNIIL